MEPTVLVVLGDCRLDHSDPEAVLTKAQRRLLQRLALAAPHGVRLVDLAEAIWEGRPPTHFKATIHNQVSRIRAAHGDEVVVTTTDGYRLGIATDAQLLELWCGEAERRLHDGDTRGSYDLSDAAVRLAGSPALPDLEHAAGVTAMRRALAVAHRSAQVLRLEAALRLGWHAWSTVEAERLAAEDEFDERRQAMLARALNLSGRRGDALAVLLRTRRTLREKLGIDGGPLLQQAEDEILRPGIAPRPSTPGDLVGREVEVRTVLSAMARGSVVEVVGEPGIGVSRLLEHLNGQLRGLAVRAVLVSAQEHQDEAAGVLRALLDELGADPGPRGPVAGFAAAVAEATSPTPVVILVDDTHLVGPTARQALARAVDTSDVRLVLGGRRPTWGPGTERIVLSPLSREDVAAVAAAAGSAPCPAELDRLVVDSGGNPAVLQILLARDTGPDSSPTVRVPGSLAALVDQLLADLGAETRQFVERAAVAGDGYPWEVLNPPSETCDLMVCQDVDGSVRFRHGAVRDEIAQRLVPARREELHAWLGAAAREAGAPAHLVARHVLAAGSLAGDDVVEACRAAAKESTRQGAHPDTVVWLSRALGVSTVSGRDRVRLLVQLGDAQRLAGDPAHLPTLRRALVEAIELADEDAVSRACVALLQLGGRTSTEGSHADLDDFVAQALTGVTAPLQRAPVLAAASLAWSLTGHAARSRDHFDEAERLATAPEGRARVLPFAYMALGMPGDLERRRALAAELLALAEEIDHPTAAFEGWQLTYSVALQDGDGDAVREAVARMGDLVPCVGDVRRRWVHHFALAAVAHLEGRDAEVERIAEEAKALFAPVSRGHARAAHFGQVIGLRLTQGRLAELTEPLEWLLAQQPGVAAWHAAYALSGAAAGWEPAKVGQHVRLAWDLARPDITWLAAHVLSARAVAIVGDGALAELLVERLAPWSGHLVWQGTCSYGPVDTALAVLHRCLGDQDAAAEDVRRARRLIERLDAEPFAAELAQWGLV